MADRQFAAKSAFVTGAGSGIGRAAALAFAEQGARVAVSDIDINTAQDTARAIQAQGGEAVAFGLDVACVADVDRVIGSVVEHYGRLDIAINNAGIFSPMHRLGEISEEEFDRGVAVNLKGVWACLRAEVRVMGNGSAIINTASTASLIASARASTYTATKHALIGLTKAAALDYADAGIRINAVCPGLIDTALSEAVLRDPERREALFAQLPMGRAGRAAEVASAMVWLASEGAGFVTGTHLVIDGGRMAR